MELIEIFSVWAASTFGLMWIKSGQRQLLRCNWMTAGVAAALIFPFYTALFWTWRAVAGFIPDALNHPFVPLILRDVSPRVLLGFGLSLLMLPASCFLSIYSSHYWLPGFRVKIGRVFDCALLFAGLLVCIGFLAGILQLFGAALMAGIFGVGMRQSDYHSRRNDYY
ncbi:MAG TPA: hypothetical protein V6D19_01045 [Stenomitos sp.]